MIGLLVVDDLADDPVSFLVDNPVIGTLLGCVAKVIGGKVVIAQVDTMLNAGANALVDSVKVDVLVGDMVVANIIVLVEIAKDATMDGGRRKMVV